MSWFQNDLERVKKKWIQSYGIPLLIEDATRAGVDVTQFPEYHTHKKQAEKASNIPKCDLCQTYMVEKVGPYGSFLACPRSSKEKPHPTKSMRRKK